MIGTDKKSATKIPVRVKSSDPRASPKVTKTDGNISESHLMESHDEEHLSTTEVKSKHRFGSDGPPRPVGSKMMVRAESSPNESDDEGEYWPQSTNVTLAVI